MALIFLGQSRCALCDTILTETDQIVATSHFIADRQHPLWRFSDAGMHQTCFLVWEQREAFITLFNQVTASSVFGRDTIHHMEPDGSITTRLCRGAQDRSNFETRLSTLSKLYSQGRRLKPDRSAPGNIALVGNVSSVDAIRHPRIL
jgi:hypothetical protein